MSFAVCCLFLLAESRFFLTCSILGFFLASYITPLQPWLLSFSAGAMIFVVVEDLIPEAKLEENPHLATWSFMAGFIVMMILDITLG